MDNFDEIKNKILNRQKIQNEMGTNSKKMNLSKKEKEKNRKEEDAKKSITNRALRGNKIAKAKNLDDIITTLKDKVSLGSNPINLPQEKANKCLTRIINPSKYKGEDIQLSQMRSETKPSIPHVANSATGVKSANSFIVEKKDKNNEPYKDIVDRWCIDLPVGSIFAHTNRNLSILNALDFVAYQNLVYYAVEQKSNNSKQYVQTFIETILNKKNKYFEPICIVPDKNIYNKEYWPYLRTNLEFTNQFKKGKNKVCKNIDELISFLWHIYSETGKYLLPDEFFSLSDGGKINRSFGNHRRNFKKKMIEKGLQNPELQRKADENYKKWYQRMIFGESEYFSY